MIVVDRIEGDRAILEIEGESVEVAVAALPNGCREGSVLAFSVCDEQGSKMQRDNEERLARLRESDPGDMEIDI